MTIGNWREGASLPNPSEQLSPTQVPRVQIVTGPALEPVTAAELGNLLKLDAVGDDANTLTALLTSARVWAETWTGRAFINRTAVIYYDQFPQGRIIELPLSPISAVESVSYFNEADVDTDLAATDYVLDLIGSPARIAFKRTYVYPSPVRVANALAVALTAGYGATAALVPEGIKTAIRLLAAELYEARGAQREADVFGPNRVMPADALMLLEPYKIAR